MDTLLKGNCYADGLYSGGKVENVIAMCLLRRQLLITTKPINNTGLGLNLKVCVFL